MDKFKFVRDGMSRLPPGFRFQPTEEELVFQYLKCKVFSCALPTSIIPEINVCKYDPWDLPGGDGGTEEERYFFSNNEAKYRNGNRTNRSTPSGYWKATGSGRKIVAPTSTRNTNSSTVGMKKTLVFYASGKGCGGYSRTGWVMHEYRLVSTETCACISQHVHHCCSKMENWVLCRIFCKKMSTQWKHGGGEMVKERKGKALTMERDRDRENGRGCISSTASSSCSSSSFTEITSTRSSGLEQSCSGTDDFSAS